jgi:hypothetical protein
MISTKTWAVLLLAPASVSALAADARMSGFIRKGILESHPADARVPGVRQYPAELGAASCLRNAVLQTVGERACDRFSVSVVSSPGPRWHRAEDAAL